MAQQGKAPNPLITVLLWGAFAFLGYQLFFANKPGKNDARTTDQVFERIMFLNQEANDAAIVPEVQIYKRKLEAEKESGRLTQEQVDQKGFVADIITYETMYSNGLKNDNQGKLNTAYNSHMRGLRDKWEKSPRWTQTIKVAPIEGKFEGGSITPETFYQALVADLSVMNKDAKILGYIPGYHLMEWLVALTGGSAGFSYWFAALLLAILVRLAVFPLAQKQFMWGRRMQQLAPYIKEIKEKFTDKKTGKVTDQQAMTMETMDLYKRYGFNPFAGCLPMVIQLPLFLLIYQCMLLYRFEFTKGYFLWVQPGATSFLGLPLAVNLGEKDYLLIVIYGISMIVTTLLTPVSDPSNVRQQRLIGISVAVLFSVMMFFYPLPSAFIVYWIFTNILATIQSLYVYRMPVPPLEQVQTTAGGVIPTTSRDMNGKTSVDPGFFGKTGKSSAKKKKKR